MMDNHLRQQDNHHQQDLQEDGGVQLTTWRGLSISYSQLSLVILFVCISSCGAGFSFVGRKRCTVHVLFHLVGYVWVPEISTYVNFCVCVRVVRKTVRDTWTAILFTSDHVHGF